VTLANRPDWWDTDLQLQLADAVAGGAPDAAPSQPGSPTRPASAMPRAPGARRRAAHVAPSEPPPTPAGGGGGGSGPRPWAAEPKRPPRAASPPPVPVARIVAAPVQFSYVLADDTGDIHVNATTSDVEFLDVRLASGAAAAAAAAHAASPAAAAAAAGLAASSDGSGARSPRGGAGGGSGALFEGDEGAGAGLPTVFSGLSASPGSSPTHRSAVAPPAARVINIVTSAAAAAAAAPPPPAPVHRTPSALSLSRQATSRAPSPGLTSSWRSARSGRGGAGGTSGGGGSGDAAAGGGDSDADSEQDLGAGFETYPYLLQPALPEGDEVRAAGRAAGGGRAVLGCPRLFCLCQVTPTPSQTRPCHLLPTTQLPGISLIRLLDELPAAEAAHLAQGGAGAAGAAPGAAAPRASGGGRDAGAAAGGGAAPYGRRRGAARPAFHVAYSHTSDGTVACQLYAASALVQWPFLTDASLASALAGVFRPDWGRPPPPLGQGLVLQRTPWMYFNVVLRDSQLFVPALSPHLLPAPLAGADVVPTLWGQVQELLLRQVAALADPERGFDAPGSDWGRLEASGLALTFGAPPVPPPTCPACSLRAPCPAVLLPLHACSSGPFLRTPMYPTQTLPTNLPPLHLQARCATATFGAATTSASRASTCGARRASCATATRTSQTACCRSSRWSWSSATRCPASRSTASWSPSSCEAPSHQRGSPWSLFLPCAAPRAVLAPPPPAPAARCPCNHPPARARPLKPPPSRRALRKMAFLYLVRKRRRAAAPGGATAPSPPPGAAAGTSPDAKRGAADATSVGRSSGRSGGPNQPLSTEERLLQLAAEHAAELFAEAAGGGDAGGLEGDLAAAGVAVAALPLPPAGPGGGGGGAHAHGAFGVLRRPHKSELVVRVTPVTVRAAFSNVKLWAAFMADGRLGGEVGGWGLGWVGGGAGPCSCLRTFMGNAADLWSSTTAPCAPTPTQTTPAQAVEKGLGVWLPHPDLLPAAIARKRAGLPPAAPPGAGEFRRAATRLDLQVAGLSVVLCDDKPSTFGAPDILQVRRELV
jgi:hypothetical protein